MGFSNSRLSPLQRRVLEAFRDVEGVWLTGGAALGGFHLGHRGSKDLDFFTAQGEQLDELGSRLRQWCAEENVQLVAVQTFPGFRRVRVWTDDDETLVDLVHETATQIVPLADKPVVDGIRVDPLLEIRANKIAALLGRAETKDLLDLYFLQQNGLDPVDGIVDAQEKDGGLDTATLAWVLSSMHLDLEGLTLHVSLALPDLERFRSEFVASLQKLSWPSSEGDQ